MAGSRLGNFWRDRPRQSCRGLTRMEDDLDGRMIYPDVLLSMEWRNSESIRRHYTSSLPLHVGLVVIVTEL
jgi:hypothetical protein